MSDANGQIWPTLPLRTIATEMCLGKMLDKQKNRGTLQPYLRNVNVRWFSFDLSDLKEMRFEESEGTRFDLRVGDLVICEGGEPGRAAVWRGQTENAKIQKALHRVRFHRDEYDPTFAMYYLYFGTITNSLASHYTGTTIKHLTGVALSQVQFPVLSIDEQRRIVAKIEELFSDLDAGVAALKRAKANLKRYRAAVLKSAVEGKLTEGWRAKHPAKETASALLARILKERRQKWEADQIAKFTAAEKEPPKNWREKYVEPTPPNTSGLPELPNGWCWASVEQCASEVTVGHVGPMKDEYVADGIPFLRSQNVRPLRYDRAGLRFITGIFNNELKKSKLLGGELLVVRSGNIGEACVYPNDQPEANCADLVITRLVTGVDAHFAAAFVVSPLGQALVGGKRTGSALSHFNVGAMAKGPLPLPPVAEQVEIVKIIAEKLSQIDAAETQIEHGLLRASRLRQSILKQAFEGKLVPQDPNDEPASVLMERLRASRSDHEGNGKAATQTTGSRPKSKRVKEKAAE